MEDQVYLPGVGYVSIDCSKKIEDALKNIDTVSEKIDRHKKVKIFPSYSDACCFFNDKQFVPADDICFDNNNNQYWMNEGCFELIDDFYQQKGSMKLTCNVDGDYREYFFWYCETNEPVDDILIDVYTDP